MSQEYNLAGKTLVVEKIKQLKGASRSTIKSEYIRQVAKTAQADVKAGSEYYIQASETMIERDDTSRESQSITLAAVIHQYQNPNPKFEINGLPRMCAYHTGDTKADLIEDLEDLIENETPFTPDYSGTNNWSRGGSLFEVGDTVSVVYFCSDNTYVTAIMGVTTVGSSTVTGVVSSYKECAQGFDDRDTSNVILYIPRRKAIPLDIVLYDGTDVKDTLRLEVQNVTRHRRTFGVSETQKGTTYVEEDGTEKNFIEGDSYVEVSVSGEKKTAVVKFWFNDQWQNIENVTDYTRYDEVLTDSLPDVFSIYQGENHVEASGYDWFKQVIAEHISAVYYFVKGAIFGYGYGGNVVKTNPVGQRATGKAFIIDANGVMEASEAYFKNCEIDGASIISSLLFSNGAEINHPYFKTISTAGTDMTVENLPSKTHWYTGDINWNTVFPTANSFTDFSDSYINNSTTISRGIRVTDPSYQLISSGITVGSYTFGPGSWGGTATLISSVQYKGTYTLSFNAPNATYSLIYVNGNQVLSGAYDSKSTTITLNKGDRVTCECGNSIYVTESTYTVKANSVTLSGNGYSNVGIYLIGGSTYFYNSFNEYKPSSTRWYFKNGSGTVLFDSNSNIRYAHLESIVTSYMSSLASGKTYTATGIVTYNGISCTVATISKDSASTGRLTIFDSVPNFYVINMAANEYSNISGDVQILGSQAGILTHAIYPEDTETYDIGEGGKQYRRIYCVNVVESSRRDLKTNIEPFTDNAIDLLKTVEVSKYNLKCDMELPDDEIVDYIGFIADDTDSRLAGKKHDKFNHINCIGVLIKAVQELSAEVEQLKAERQNN